MASMLLAPPTEWPAIAMRDRSISGLPFHMGCGPVSASSTKAMSAARPRPSFAQNGSSLLGGERASSLSLVKMLLTYVSMVLRPR
jgi:hypothetical protein